MYHTISKHMKKKNSPYYLIDMHTCKAGTGSGNKWLQNSNNKNLFWNVHVPLANQDDGQ